MVFMCQEYAYLTLFVMTVFNVLILSVQMLNGFGVSMVAAGFDSE